MSKSLLRAPAGRRGIHLHASISLSLFAWDPQGKEKRLPWGLGFPTEPWASLPHKAPGNGKPGKSILVRSHLELTKPLI